MAIKLIAIDLDGTLVNNEGNISDENKKAIQKAKDEGVKVVLCTGRPLLGMVEVLKECNLLEDGDYGIKYNGGLIQKTKTGETVKQVTFEESEIDDIYNMVTDLNMPLNLIDLNRIYEPPYPKGHESKYDLLMKALPFEPIDMNNLPSDLAVNKMVMCRPKEELDTAIRRIPNSFYERYSIIKSRPVLLEFMPKGVDKGTGLSMLEELLDIKQEEMMAIGDMENDIAMVDYAGLGVAMENGAENVKEISQFITKSNDAHGVAHAINKFVLKSKIEN